MRQLSDAEIKYIELQLLRKFADYCDQNDLSYFLIYGTLLGAVRHKGFIPWDDDIDVCMPRTDYERFIEMQHKDKVFNYVCIDDNTSSQPFIKLLDMTTQIKQDTIDENEVSHLWVDVFPLDYMPDSPEEYLKAFRHVKFLRMLSVYAVARYGAGTNTFRSLAKIPAIFICKCIGRFRLARMINNYCKNIATNTNHVNILCWGSRGIEAHSDISIFKERVRLEFEGYYFWAPAGWDKYLSLIYPDYLKLPPEAERQGHHMIAYLLDSN